MQPAQTVSALIVDHRVASQNGSTSEYSYLYSYKCDADGLWTLDISSGDTVTTYYPPLHVYPHPLSMGLSWQSSSDFIRAAGDGSQSNGNYTYSSVVTEEDVSLEEFTGGWGIERTNEGGEPFATAFAPGVGLLYDGARTLDVYIP